MNKNIKDYKAQMQNIPFSADFVSRTVSALKAEARSDNEGITVTMREHAPAKNNKIKLIKTVMISAAACFICVFAVRVVTLDRSQPDLAQNLETTAATATTTEPISASSAPEVIEQIEEFTPYAAVPISETATIVAFDNILIVTESGAVTTTVSSAESSADGGVSGNTAPDSATPNTATPPTAGRTAPEGATPGSGNTAESEVTYDTFTAAFPEDADTATDADSAGNSAGNSESAAIPAYDSPAEAAEDAGDEMLIDDSADDMLIEEDSAEEAEETPFSPIRENGIYIGNFEKLTGYTGTVTYTPDPTSHKVADSAQMAALARVLYDTLGSEFKADKALANNSAEFGTPTLGNDTIQMWLDITGAADSYTIVLYKNALTISYTDPDGNSYLVAATITARQHDAIFKALYTTLYSESEYELYIARETGK